MRPEDLPSCRLLPMAWPCVPVSVFCFDVGCIRRHLRDIVFSGVYMNVLHVFSGGAPAVQGSPVVTSNHAALIANALRPWRSRRRMAAAAEWHVYGC